MELIKNMNLAVRFVVELVGLWAAGCWGFTQFDNWCIRVLLGIGIPGLMAAAWGIFRVPGDGGAPIVVVGGQIRLALEVSYFLLALGLLTMAGRASWAIAFAIVLVINYGLDYERVIDFATGRR